MREEGKKKTKEKSKENYVLIKDTPITSISKVQDRHTNGWCTAKRGFDWLAPSLASISAQEFPSRKIRWMQIPHSLTKCIWMSFKRFA